MPQKITKRSVDQPAPRGSDVLLWDADVCHIALLHLKT